MEAEAAAIRRAHGVRCIGISADVSRKEDIDAAVTRISAAFDGLDILINNAGTGTSETIMDAPDEKWNHFWDLHVMAAVRLSRAMVPLMSKRGGGVILNTASICAKQPLGYEPIYNTTKAALVMFSKCLANELIKDNIRVNAVNPGLILTPDWKKTAAVLTQGTATTVDQYLDKIAKDNAPIGRFATPGGARPLLRLPLLAAVQLLRRLQLLRGRRLAEDHRTRERTSWRNLSIALADTIMKRHPDPLTIPYKRWCYVHGYVLAGFEKLFASTGDPRYFDYIRKYVGRPRHTPTGDVPAFTGESLDDMMAGTAIVAVFQKDRGRAPERARRRRIRRSFDDYPRNSDGGFWHARGLPHQMWIDGVFMGQMFLARYGAVIGDRPRLLRRGGAADRRRGRPARKGDSGLFFHGFDESRNAVGGQGDRAFLRTSGAKVLDGMRWSSPKRSALIELKGRRPGESRRHPARAWWKVLPGSRIRARASWYQVVDKGERPDNWHDTSGSAMFVYAIQRAVELGCRGCGPIGPWRRRATPGVRAKATRGHRRPRRRP